MPEKTLGDILTKIGDDAQSSLGMTREQVITLAERKKVLVGGIVDQNFNVTIKNGKGSVDESKYTFGVTITGYFVIQSPSQGTWDIVAKVADKTVVNKSGVSKGEQIPFNGFRVGCHDLACGFMEQVIAKMAAQIAICDDSAQLFLFIDDTNTAKSFSRYFEHNLRHF